MTDRVRILVADDHPLFAEGLSATLASEPRFELVGVAHDGREAVALSVDQSPDVVVMDLHMPQMSGVDAIRELRRVLPGCRVLVLTMFEEEESVWAAIRAGAHGYVLKGAPQEEIRRAVHAVAAGELIFGPSIAARMLEFFAAGPAEARPAFPELTGREREILGLLARGRSNREIAQRLYLSDKTIANNVTAIFRKLDVTDRAHAIVRARDAGLGSRE